MLMNRDKKDPRWIFLMKILSDVTDQQIITPGQQEKIMSHAHLHLMSEAETQLAAEFEADCQEPTTVQFS